MSSTLLLNPDNWDLTVDVNGNIAVALEPYSLAQDVASAARLYAGELYYDKSQGIKYSAILGELPPLQFIKNAYVQAALSVPGIVAAACFITGLTNRVLSGQIQTTDKNGSFNVFGFGNSSTSRSSNSVIIAELTSDAGAVLTDEQGNILVNQ